MQHATFQSLNGLRGIAALAVVLFHFSLRRPFGVDFGFIAVDLFFVLSGFVIAASYDRRLASGLGVGAFLRVRVIRLYPLYALGTMIGVATVLCSQVARVRIGGGAGLLHALCYAAVMLPTPPAPGGWADAALYPLDDPAWSLFFELVINLVYAASHRIWTISRLLALLATGLLAFAATYAATGTLYGDGGWDWASVPFGLLRVTYAFFFGVLIDRLRPRLVRLPPAATALASVLARAGAMSYPLYAVHKPMHALAASVVEALRIHVPVLAFDLALVVALVPLASWLEQAYDRPVRARLSRWFGADAAPARSASTPPSTQPAEA